MVAKAESETRDLEAEWPRLPAASAEEVNKDAAQAPKATPPGEREHPAVPGWMQQSAPSMAGTPPFGQQASRVRLPEPGFSGGRTHPCGLAPRLPPTLPRTQAEASPEVKNEQKQMLKALGYDDDQVTAMMAASKASLPQQQDMQDWQRQKQQWEQEKAALEAKLTEYRASLRQAEERAWQSGPSGAAGDDAGGRAPLAAIYRQLSQQQEQLAAMHEVSKAEKMEMQAQLAAQMEKRMRAAGSHSERARECSEDEDDNESVASSVASSATGYRLKPLSTPETAALKTKLTRGTVVEWTEMAAGDVTSNCEIFDEDTFDWTEMHFWKRYKASPALQAEDKYLARQIKACLDPEATAVKIFKKKMVRDDRAERASGSTLPPTKSSGWRMWQAIKMSEMTATGARASADVDAFNNKTYVTPGMSYDEFTLAIELAREHFHLLPEEEQKGKHADIYMLLRKMPPGTEEKVAKFKEKLVEYTALGKPPKYSYEEYAEKLSVIVCNMKAGTIRQVHTPWQPGKGKGEKGKGGGKGDATPNPRGGPPCRCCGSMQHGHDSKDADGKKICTKLCKCGQSICVTGIAKSVGGVPGGRCLLELDVLPPRESILDMRDEPIPNSLYKSVERAHKQMKERGAHTARQATMAPAKEEPEPATRFTMMVLRTSTSMTQENDISYSVSAAQSDTVTRKVHLDGAGRIAA